MTRRTLFTHLPLLMAAPAIASAKQAPALEVTAFQYDTAELPWPREPALQSHAIIHAALRKLDRLAPGELASASEYEAAKFHLDSMYEEGFPGSPSQRSLELAKRIESRPSNSYPAWRGDSPFLMSSVEEIIASGPTSFRDTDELDRFYGGDQWDKLWKADRERGPNPRPCLVFNRLPGLVSAALARQRLDCLVWQTVRWPSCGFPQKSSTFPAFRPPYLFLSADERDDQRIALQRAVTFLNRDVQVLFNLEMSNRAERVAIRKWANV